MNTRTKSIVVFEHDCLRVGQTNNGIIFHNRHLEAIQQFMGEKGTPYFSLIHRGVKFCEYVGVLRIGDLTIEILPKADRNGNETDWRNLLISMLRKVGIFNFTAPSQANLKLKANNLLELYFEMFISEVETLVHHGLVKKYRKDECNLPVLKGSLNFTQHVRNNQVHQERFYTRHTIYDRKNPYNQLLFKTLLLLKEIKLNPVLSSRISNLIIVFPDVPDISVNESWFTKLSYTRKTESYRKAIEIARLLLLNYHPDLSQGKDHVLALMFDMNLLWEKFVYMSLRKHFSAGEIRAQSSKPYWKLDGYRPVNLKPDIVITLGDQTFVIDTKWKILSNKRPADDDIRQMYAYSKYWKSTQTILCYPGDGTCFDGYFFDENSDMKANTCSLITIGIYPKMPVYDLQKEISEKIIFVLNN